MNILDPLIDKAIAEGFTELQEQKNIYSQNVNQAQALYHEEVKTYGQECAKERLAIRLELHSAAYYNFANRLLFNLRRPPPIQRELPTKPTLVINTDLLPQIKMESEEDRIKRNEKLREERYQEMRAKMKREAEEWDRHWNACWGCGRLVGRHHCGGMGEG